MTFGGFITLETFASHSQHFEDYCKKYHIWKSNFVSGLWISIHGIVSNTRMELNVLMVFFNFVKVTKDVGKTYLHSCDNGLQLSTDTLGPLILQFVWLWRFTWIFNLIRSLNICTLWVSKRMDDRCWLWLLSWPGFLNLLLAYRSN